MNEVIKKLSTCLANISVTQVDGCLVNRKSLPKMKMFSSKWVFLYTKKN